MSLKHNIIANYVGQGWRALMSLAFIPLYIKYLGIEAYGLIGTFAMLQAGLALLDMGMKPALGREMARFTSGAVSAQTIRDLLRSVELIAIAVAIAVALGIWAASDWLASDWVKAEKLPVHIVAQAFSVMGAVTALRFVEDVYVNSLVGLQRQVLQNAVTSIMATGRGLGAVGLLAWVSPTIRVFFLWQGAISLATVVVSASVVYRILPRAPRTGRPSLSALAGIWRFAAGMVAIAVLAMMLTQIDKILLSRLLNLEAFGRYTLAGAIAGVLFTMLGPITAAFYPRLVELATRRDEPALGAAYHQAAQLVTVSMGSAAVVLILFGDKIVAVWTGNTALALQVAPLVRVLAMGSLLNGLMWLPYQLQLAHGWTTLTIGLNIVAVGLVVPAILWAVPLYGAIGAAWIWCGLNAGYLIFGIYLMHRRLLPTEKWRWYGHDIGLPLIAATTVAWLCRRIAPRDLGRLGELGVLVAISSCVLFAAAMTTGKFRKLLTGYRVGTAPKRHNGAPPHHEARPAGTEKEDA